MNNFFFTQLPLIALVSFLAGSIYRYRRSGFKVTSLSSQILESKLLFFGSRPFHWGIVTLFFGHLAGFLVPRAVLAWNSRPLRLYILEITALVFAILCLTGIIILIYRRFDVKRIRVNTSIMDSFVFVTLLIVILTGIYTAVFNRWGSSWFASVMTPYLRSVFTLNPDAVPLTALPLMAKIHFISAFILVGMLPYTRLIHMLVYPIHYFWREYQLVIWNKKSKSTLNENTPVDL